MSKTTTATETSVKTLTFGQTEFTVNGAFDTANLSDIQKNGLSDSVFNEGEKISFPENLQLSAVMFKSGSLKSEKPYPAFITNENKPLSLSSFNIMIGKPIMLVSETTQKSTELCNIGLNNLLPKLAGKSFIVKKIKGFVQEFDQTTNKPKIYVNPIDGQTYRSMKQKSIITLQAV
jgi:hypothetical protein